ncbi:MAG: hypothetical protein JWM76_1557 [Pseudonocardiales bacterium]|nr:hypothetical protein [Pseudonocardiales bacterium]
MGIRSWLHRSNNADGTPHRAPAKRKSTTKRVRKAKDRHPRPPRQDQYDSEFITRYGDPFD